MPLLSGEKNIGRNIREMVRAGHPRAQAIAAAMRKAGKAKKKKLSREGAPIRFSATIPELIANAFSGREDDDRAVHMLADAFEEAGKPGHAAHLREATVGYGNAGRMHYQPIDRWGLQQSNVKYLIDTRRAEKHMLSHPESTMTSIGHWGNVLWMPHPDGKTIVGFEIRNEWPSVRAENNHQRLVNEGAISLNRIDQLVHGIPEEGPAKMSRRHSLVHAIKRKRDPYYERMDEGKGESFESAAMERSGRPIRFSATPAEIHDDLKNSPEDLRIWHMLADSLEENGKPGIASAVRQIAVGGHRNERPWYFSDITSDQFENNTHPAFEGLDEDLQTHHANGHVAGIPIAIWPPVFEHEDYGETIHPDAHWGIHIENPLHPEKDVLGMTGVDPHTADTILHEVDGWSRRSHEDKVHQWMHERYPTDLSREGKPIKFSAGIPELISEVAANPKDERPVHMLADAFEEAGMPHHAQHLRAAIARGKRLIDSNDPLDLMAAHREPYQGSFGYPGHTHETYDPIEMRGINYETSDMTDPSGWERDVIRGEDQAIANPGKTMAAHGYGSTSLWMGVPGTTKLIGFDIRHDKADMDSATAHNHGLLLEGAYPLDREKESPIDFSRSGRPARLARGDVFIDNSIRGRLTKIFRKRKSVDTGAPAEPPFAMPEALPIAPPIATPVAAPIGMPIAKHIVPPPTQARKWHGPASSGLPSGTHVRGDVVVPHAPRPARTPSGMVIPPEPVKPAAIAPMLSSGTHVRGGLTVPPKSKRQSVVDAIREKRAIKLARYEGGTSFAHLNRYLGNKSERPSGNNRKILRLDNGDIAVRLHNTNVVISHPDDTYTLNAGGYHTATTRSTINAFSPANVSFAQRGGTPWFFNGVRVSPGGNPIHLQLPPEHQEEAHRLMEAANHEREYGYDFKGSVPRLQAFLDHHYHHKVPLDHPDVQMYLNEIRLNPEDMRPSQLYADWLDEHGIGDVADQVRKAAPARLRKSGRPIHMAHAELTGWMKPSGEMIYGNYHTQILHDNGMLPDPESERNHDHAFKNGWMRIYSDPYRVHVHNDYMGPTGRQKSALEDLAIERGLEDISHQSERGRELGIIWSKHDQFSRDGAPIRMAHATPEELATIHIEPETIPGFKYVFKCVPELTPDKRWTWVVHEGKSVRSHEAEEYVARTYPGLGVVRKEHGGTLNYEPVPKHISDLLDGNFWEWHPDMTTPEDYHRKVNEGMPTRIVMRRPGADTVSPEERQAYNGMFVNGPSSIRENLKKRFGGVIPPHVEPAVQRLESGRGIFDMALRRSGGNADQAKDAAASLLDPNHSVYRLYDPAKHGEFDGRFNGYVGASAKHGTESKAKERSFGTMSNEDYDFDPSKARPVGATDLETQIVELHSAAKEKGLLGQLRQNLIAKALGRNPAYISKVIARMVNKGKLPINMAPQLESREIRKLAQSGLGYYDLVAMTDEDGNPKYNRKQISDVLYSGRKQGIVTGGPTSREGRRTPLIQELLKHLETMKPKEIMGITDESGKPKYQYNQIRSAVSVRARLKAKARTQMSARSKLVKAIRMARGFGEIGGMAGEYSGLGSGTHELPHEPKASRSLHPLGHPSDGPFVEEGPWECPNCGDEHDEHVEKEENKNDHERTWEDGTEACDQCSGHCNDCNESVDPDKLETLSTGYSRRNKRTEQICESCRQNGDYFHCADCGDLRNLNDDYSSNSSEEPVCPGCGENYFYCDNCNHTYQNEDYGEDGKCQECSNNEEEERVKEMDIPELWEHIKDADDSENLTDKAWEALSGKLDEEGKPNWSKVVDKLQEGAAYDWSDHGTREANFGTILPKRPKEPVPPAGEGIEGTVSGIPVRIGAPVAQPKGFENHPIIIAELIDKSTPDHEVHGRLSMPADYLMNLIAEMDGDEAVQQARHGVAIKMTRLQSPADVQLAINSFRKMRFLTTPRLRAWITPTGQIIHLDDSQSHVRTAAEYLLGGHPEVGIGATSEFIRRGGHEHEADLALEKSGWVRQADHNSFSAYRLDPQTHAVIASHTAHLKDRDPLYIETHDAPMGSKFMSAGEFRKMRNAGDVMMLSRRDAIVNRIRMRREGQPIRNAATIQELLSAVHSNLHDTRSSLMLADQLEEQGMPGHATVIRKRGTPSFTHLSQYDMWKDRPDLKHRYDLAKFVSDNPGKFVFGYTPGQTELNFQVGAPAELTKRGQVRKKFSPGLLVFSVDAEDANEAKELAEQLRSEGALMLEWRSRGSRAAEEGGTGYTMHDWPNPGDKHVNFEREPWPQMKPWGCKCKYPEKVLRNGSGHGYDEKGKPCPIHRAWLEENIFGRKKKVKSMREAVVGAIRMKRGLPIQMARVIVTPQSIHDFANHIYSNLKQTFLGALMHTPSMPPPLPGERDTYGHVKVVGNHRLPIHLEVHDHGNDKYRIEARTKMGDFLGRWWGDSTMAKGVLEDMAPHIESFPYTGLDPERRKIVEGYHGDLQRGLNTTYLGERLPQQFFDGIRVAKVVHHSPHGEPIEEKLGETRLPMEGEKMARGGRPVRMSKEPWMADYLRSKLAHNGGMPQEPKQYKGFLLPNGEHLATGSEKGGGYYDHEEFAPSAEEAEAWGWPEDVVAKIRGQNPHESNSYSSMIHMMKRGPIVRIGATSYGRGSGYLSIHSEAPITHAQKEEISNYVATRKPDHVSIWHMGQGEQVSKREIGNIDEHLEKLQQIPVQSRQPLSMRSKFRQAIKFAAMRDRGVDDAGAQERIESGNHSELIKALEGVLTRSGLSPHRVYPAVHDFMGQARASAVAEVFGERFPGAADYGAAWQGLIAKQPGLVVFRSHPQGRDSVYRFAFKGPTAAMSQLLDKVGVANRVFVPHGPGTHVYLYDPGRSLRPGVADLISRLGLQAVEHTGNGRPIGGGDDNGRAGYRDEIKQQEQTRMARPISNSPDAYRQRIAKGVVAKMHPSEHVSKITSMVMAEPGITRTKVLQWSKIPSPHLGHAIDSMVANGQLKTFTPYHPKGGAMQLYLPEHEIPQQQPSRRAQILSLMQRGHSQAKAARTLGITPQAVGNLLKRKAIKNALDPEILGHVADRGAGDERPWALLADHLQENGLPALAHIIMNGERINKDANLWNPGEPSERPEYMGAYAWLDWGNPGKSELMTKTVYFPDTMTAAMKIASGNWSNNKSERNFVIRDPMMIHAAAKELEKDSLDKHNLNTWTPEEIENGRSTDLENANEYRTIREHLESKGINSGSIRFAKPMRGIWTMSPEEIGQLQHDTGNQYLGLGPAYHGTGSRSDFLEPRHYRGADVAKNDLDNGYVKVTSSWIAGIRRVKGGNAVDMVVRRGGKIYRYTRAPKGLLQRWLNATSPGKFWHSYIRAYLSPAQKLSARDIFKAAIRMSRGAA